MKISLVKYIAEKLVSYGYIVYLSADKRYGFYTDGHRVVSFGGHWEWSVDFSGNYEPSKYSSRCGTGWQIRGEQCDITKVEAWVYIHTDAPRWADNPNPIYSTPDQILARYPASGYVKFEKAE